MNPLYDLYVIESALLSGEVDDAVNIINKNRKLYGHVEKQEGMSNLKRHMRVLNGIMDALENNIGIDNFRETMTGNYVYETEDGNMENFVNSFSYMVYYSIDRYNIHYPKYDGKRCGDL